MPAAHFTLLCRPERIHSFIHRREFIVRKRNPVPHAGRVLGHGMATEPTQRRASFSDRHPTSVVAGAPCAPGTAGFSAQRYRTKDKPQQSKNVSDQSGTSNLRPLSVTLRSAERWPSGRRRTPGTRVGGKPPPGFESLSLRQPHPNVTNRSLSRADQGFRCGSEITPRCRTGEASPRRLRKLSRPRPTRPKPYGSPRISRFPRTRRTASRGSPTGLRTRAQPAV